MSARVAAMHRSPRWPALALVAAIHVVVITALLQMRNVQHSVQAVRRLSVSIVQPEQRPPPPPEARIVAKRVVRETPKPADPIPPPDIVHETPSPLEIVRPLEAPRLEVPVHAPVTIAPPAPDAAPAPITPASFTAAYLDNPPPRYPPLSRRAAEAGKVLLRVRVMPDGRASEVAIATGSGHPRLDQAAVEAVSKWRFGPASQRGVAIEAWVIVPIAFELER